MAKQLCLVCRKPLLPIPCVKNVGLTVGKNDGFVGELEIDGVLILYALHWTCGEKLLLNAVFGKR